MRLAILLLLASAPVAHCQTQEASDARHYRWSLAAVSASAAADILSSRGHYELNPVLGRGQFGTHQIATKVSLTAGMLAIQQLPGCRRHRRALAVANFAAAGFVGAVAVRNARIR